MRRIGFTILCLVVIWGVTSCEDEQFPDSGQAISFASLSEQLVTRGTPIDANADIPNMGVFAYYTGNGLSNNWAAQGATATPAFMNNVQVTNNSGAWSYANPVYWPAANDANVSFFAYSPYATGNMGNGITVNISTGIPTITYTVPTSCAAQPDLMVSVLKNDLNKTTGSPVVSFAMSHALTSVGFKAAGNGEEITGIKITEVHTSGTLTTAADGTFAWSASGTGNFEAIPNGATLDGTSADVIEANGYLMMIPQTLGANSRLILTLSDNSEVEFDISGHTWAPGSKVIYNIELSSEDILIVTESLLTYNNNSSSQTFTVTSTSGSGTAKPWTADFSTDNGVTWSPTCPTWLTIPTSGPGGTNISQTATLSAYAGANAEDLILTAAAVKGSPSTPYDLSTKGGSTSINTANCYIINAPGYYQLPLVYGNAIKNGATNSNAYTTTATSAFPVLGAFLRHDDNPITNPYLYNQTVPSDVVPDNAVLIWQDTSALITNINLTLDKHNLTFEVPQATIAQGNAILAVRNSSNVILWSWHIWVTPLVNADAPATDDVLSSANVAFSFMQYNLGWCTIGSTPRSVMVRVSQDGTSLSDTIIVTQNPAVSVSGGFSPYWQWGRKDPIPPSTGLGNADNTLFFGTGYSFIKAASTTATIGGSIQNPNVVYSAGAVDWCSTGGGYFNMWSVHNTTGDRSNNVVKTVYDPSPVGFTVPASNAWTGFSASNHVGLFNAGWILSLPNSETTFYPATGIRNNTTGVASSVRTGGFYWAATPTNITNARTITLNYNIGDQSSSFNFPNANSARATSCSVRCAAE